MNQVFNNYVKSLMTLNTPDNLQKGIEHNQETYMKTSKNIKKRYRSGVGSLIYLVKHSRPKLSNTFHELSNCMDEANTSHFKALLPVIK